MSAVQSGLYRQTRGNLQSYGETGDLVVYLFDDSFIGGEDIRLVEDVTAPEITGGTYTATALTGVSWDTSGDLPALRADDVEVEGIEATVGGWVVVDGDSGDVVKWCSFPPLAVSGTLPIEFAGGILADDADDDADIEALAARTVAGVSAVDGDYPPADVATALADFLGSGAGGLPGGNPAFILVDRDYGDPQDTPIALIEGAVAYFFTADGMGDWEYAGIYEGHSPDDATPATPTRAPDSQQPVTGLTTPGRKVFFSRFMLNLSTTRPGELPPHADDFLTPRIGYISDNDGINDPKFWLGMEKPQGAFEGTTAADVPVDATGFTNSSADRLQAMLEDLDGAISGGGGGGVSLGETSSTAYRGDRGKTAYDHSQVATGNPHGTSASDVGAVPTARAITAGTGLSGGGSLAADRTLSIDTSVVVDKTTAQTLANKTLTAPAITSPTGIVKADVGLGSVTNDAQLKVASNLSDLASASTARTNLNTARVLGGQGAGSTLTDATSGINTGVTLLGSTVSLPTTLAAGDMIRVRAAVEGVQNSTGARTITFVGKLGSTSAVSLGVSWSAGASTRVAIIDMTMRVTSTSAQTWDGTVAGAFPVAATGSSSEDTTSAKAFDLLISTGSTASSQSYQLKHLTLTFFPA